MENQVFVPPEDDFNKKLVDNVHPADWKNPTPAPLYNLVALGEGTAGLVAAAGAAGLGAKTALIERHLLGGDCLNYGCVPSKAIIRSSRIMAEIARVAEFGINVPDGVQADFANVMERMRNLRSGISEHDSAARFQDELGVDVFLGSGKFTGKKTIEVDGTTIRFKKAVIATGAKPFVPEVDGLAEAGYLTNETIFSLTEKPEKLLVIGGGPIGCELAQAFSRLGVSVTIIERGSQFLPREDGDAAALLAGQFEREGIKVLMNAALLKVELSGKKKIVHLDCDGTTASVEADEILIGAGRAPNVHGLGLETAGVEFDDRKGIIVDDKLRTTNANIFAAGDVCMRNKFTHAADFAARIVIQNSLFGGRARLSALTVPWCTYTDPEIAHVGMYESDAAAAGIPLDTYVRHFNEVDRAILDGEDGGFVKIHVKKGKDEIVGATIAASHAGDMISEISVAMAGKVGLKKLAGVIHPYPTQAEAIRQIGDMYNRTRLTPFMKNLFAKWFAWTRR